MFKKRAQGLSITTIVVAIIALIVIVVIIAILTGRLGAFGAGLESLGNPTKTCSSQQTTTEKTEMRGECDKEGQVSIVSSDATARGLKCCRTLSSKSNDDEVTECCKQCKTDEELQCTDCTPACKP